MNEITYNPQLNTIAWLTRSLFDGAMHVLRLAVDYKNPKGIDCSVDLLATLPYGFGTKNLISRVRSDLPEGCELSAIGSIDYMRPIYIAPGFLAESMREDGLPVPDDLDAAMTAVGLNFITLEEMETTAK